MDKRLSSGRLVTDKLILKSLKGAAAAVAVWGGLGYACHFIAERNRAEESAIEAKIAVARGVLADTVGEPFAGGTGRRSKNHRPQALIPIKHIPKKEVPIWNSIRSSIRFIRRI